ncbi:MAG: SpoIIE family protein phosphatase [Bacteroidia bacterium]|nr:SpoIIE family protein phosphatase [Bacteroidia bacterium]
MLFRTNIHIRRFLFAMLLLSLPALAQQYNIKLYSPKHGLANSVVNHILTDSRGYVWFATQGGISRFDGRTFQNYTIKNGLAGNDVTYLTEDNKGNIWAACYGSGISRFDGEKFASYGEKDGLTNTSVYNIICDRNGVIWMATRGGGIFSFNGTAFVNYTKESHGIPTDTLFAVVEDQQGMLWFGTRKRGLIRYDHKNFQVYDQKDGLMHNTVISLFSDKRGKLWIGTAGSMPQYMEHGEIKTAIIPEIGNDLISMIAEDERGNIWIASEHGLVKYFNGRYKIYNETNGLPANSVYAINTDYEGNVWMGTSNGVGLFKNEAFIAFSDKEGLSNPKVTALFQNASGVTFIGTSGGGLNIMTNDIIQKVDYIPDLTQSIILALYEAPNGELWVGLESSTPSLYVLKKSGSRYVVDRTYDQVGDGKSLKTVSGLISDGMGGVWISLYGTGVMHYTNGKFEFLDSRNGLPVEETYTVIKDSKNNLWIGTYQGGLVKYDGKKCTVFTEAEGLPDNTVYTICEDKKGNIIVGTANKGIAIYNGKSFRSLSTREGLCSDVIYTLIVDEKDRIWVGTDKGVNRISLGEDLSVNSIKYFSENDGMKSTEINPNTFMLDKSRKLWFGTTNGLIRYNPEFDYINDKPPLVVLTGIKLFYEPVQWEKLGIEISESTGFPERPELSYDKNHLTFNFQALTTDNVQYTYYLEGSEAGWSPLSTKTEAVYTNIQPGEYTFHVKAQNSDGFWSLDETAFTFIITPPFYKTWWFYTLLAIISLSAVIMFIRWRTRRLEAEKKILEERVTQRTVQLKSANEQLSVAFKDIKDSINYAKRIQEAILPLENEMRAALPEYFIMFKPRDVVSGDFYWFSRQQSRIYIAACDCTGHGVPGAFMSIIGTSLLNEVINENPEAEPGEILNALRDKLINALKQGGADSESKDGMDMMLACIDERKRKLSFAGANNPLYFIRDGKLQEFKSDKQPIGIYGHELKPFRNQELTYEQGDQFYLFSDGFPDQFGGPRGKKFLYTKFKELLLAVSGKSMPEQIAGLEAAFSEWIGKEHEQVDDVLVIGVKL